MFFLFCFASHCTDLLSNYVLDIYRVKFGSTYSAVLGRDDVPRSMFHPEVTLDGFLRMCFYSDMPDLTLFTVADTDPIGLKADDWNPSLFPNNVSELMGRLRGFEVVVWNGDSYFPMESFFFVPCSCRAGAPVEPVLIFMKVEVISVRHVWRGYFLFSVFKGFVLCPFRASCRELSCVFLSGRSAQKHCNWWPSMGRKNLLLFIGNFTF